MSTFAHTCPALTFVRGLPGAGKTTIATEYSGHGLNGTLVSADDFFVGEDGVYRFDFTKLTEAHESCQARARAILAEGGSVIVHNTFTQGWEATPYVEMIAEFNAIYTVINVFDGGLDDAALAARNVHGVPLAGIAAMRARWDRDLLAAQAVEPRKPWERG